ncbi:MAG: L-aspartate oxidase, partial [Deltaproteobacteria bacterium]
MEIKSDYLIIGSGIAGLSLALKAALVGTVNIVTKKETMDASTNYAQGGIASVLDPNDSFDLHIADTLESGAGLCNEQIVRMVVTNGPDMIKELISLGVN